MKLRCLLPETKLSLDMLEGFGYHLRSFFHYCKALQLIQFYTSLAFKYTAVNVPNEEKPRKAFRAYYIYTSCFHFCDNVRQINFVFYFPVIVSFVLDWQTYKRNSTDKQKDRIKYSWRNSSWRYRYTSMRDNAAVKRLKILHWQASSKNELHQCINAYKRVI